MKHIIIGEDHVVTKVIARPDDCDER